MATATVTLTGNVADAIGVDFDSTSTVVWVEYNTDKIVTDGSDPIRLGTHTQKVAPDGTFSLPNVVASTSLVENLQATVKVNWRNVAGPVRARQEVPFGPYDLTGLTGTIDVRTLEQVQAIPASQVSEALTSIASMRSELDDINNGDGSIPPSSIDATLMTQLARDPYFKRGFMGVIKGVNVASVEQVSDGIAFTNVASVGGGGPIPRWSLNLGGKMVSADLLPNTQYTVAAEFTNVAANTGGVWWTAAGAGLASDQTGATVTTRDVKAVCTVTFTTATDPTQTANVTLHLPTGNNQQTRVHRVGLAKGTQPVLFSGDDEDASWDGQRYLSNSTYSPAEEITPPRLAEPKLERRFAPIDPPAMPVSSRYTVGSGDVVGVTNEVRTAIGPTDPFPIKAYGNTLIGARGNVVYKSLNSGRSWTSLVDMGNLGGAPGAKGVQWMVLTVDGEAIIGRGIFGSHKSTGDFQAAMVSGNFAGVSFTQVVTTTTASDGHKGEQVDWSAGEPWSTWWAGTEYDGNSGIAPTLRDGSRYAWLSNDNANTCYPVLDKEALPQFFSDPDSSHLHFAFVDPFTNGLSTPRMWVSGHGQGINQWVLYSDDAAVEVATGSPNIANITWIPVISGDYERANGGNPGDGQPTSACCTPLGPLIGSDGLPDSDFLIPVAPDNQLGDCLRLWKYDDKIYTGLSSITKKVEPVGLQPGGANAGLWLISHRSNRNGIPGIVTLADTTKSGEAWRYQGASDQQPNVTGAWIVNGEFVARVIVAGVSDELIRGTAPYFKTSIAVPTAMSQTAAASSAITIDASTGSEQRLDLTGIPASVTVVNAVHGQVMTYTVRQTSNVGASTTLWPANFKFDGSAAPALSTANKQTSVIMRYDATLGFWFERGRAANVPTT